MYVAFALHYERCVCIGISFFDFPGQRIFFIFTGTTTGTDSSFLIRDFRYCVIVADYVIFFPFLDSHL